MKWQKLEGQQFYWRTVSGIEEMMTGVRYISQDKTGQITLEYTDGVHESANPEPQLDLSDYGSVFEIVSAIQALRPELTPA